MDPCENVVCCEGDDAESLGRVGFCTRGTLVDGFHHGRGEEMKKRRREKTLCCWMMEMKEERRINGVGVVSEIFLLEG